MRRKRTIAKRLVGAGAHYLRAFNRRTVKVLIHPLMRRLIANETARKWLNDYYLYLSWNRRYKLWNNYAKMYRSHSNSASDGVWTVRLGGKTIAMPLRSDRMWLDWDTAVSIGGHDIEIKQTYENFLFGTQVPDLFVDVGANYGTHSLIFLVHGIDTVSFEPNEQCHSKFREMCRVNGVSGRVEPVALGAKEGHTRLYFSKKETWGGSTNPERLAEAEKEKGRIHVEEVALSTIDYYLKNTNKHLILIKIDAEGSELPILWGGQQTFAKKKPLTIFESYVEDHS